MREMIFGDKEDSMVGLFYCCSCGACLKQLHGGSGAHAIATDLPEQ